MVSNPARDVTMMWRDTPTVDLANNRFPSSIVWGPLGPLTCCCPVVGHMGIADSQGRIHDFAGPHCIGVDDFMVGCVWRYAVVPNSEDDIWDASIDKADSHYNQQMHNICCNNCHHHAAMALEESGRPQWGCGGLLSVWLYCCLHGRCTWWHCLYPRSLSTGGPRLGRMPHP